LLPINLLQGFRDFKYNAANQTGSVGLTFQKNADMQKGGKRAGKGIKLFICGRPALNGFNN
jgi:hypothetical protein